MLSCSLHIVYLLACCFFPEAAGALIWDCTRYIAARTLWNHRTHILFKKFLRQGHDWHITDQLRLSKECYARDWKMSQEYFWYTYGVNMVFPSFPSFLDITVFCRLCKLFSLLYVIFRHFGCLGLSTWSLLGPKMVKQSSYIILFVLIINDDLSIEKVLLWNGDIFASLLNICFIFFREIAQKCNAYYIIGKAGLRILKLSKITF